MMFHGSSPRRAPICVSAFTLVASLGWSASASALELEMSASLGASARLASPRAVQVSQPFGKSLAAKLQLPVGDVTPAQPGADTSNAAQNFLTRFAHSALSPRSLLGYTDSALGLVDRVLQETQSAIAALPALPVSLKLSQQGAALSMPVTHESEFILGNSIYPRTALGVTRQSGFHWITQMTPQSRFFIGVERHSGDSDETLTGMGMLYALD